MVSSPWSDIRSRTTEDGAAVSDSVSRDVLSSQIDELRRQLEGLRRSRTEFKDLAEQRARELDRVRTELEACKHNLQELNLLDGFLRSGAVRALDLNAAPELRELLTSFLSRALQTALDSGAVQLYRPTGSGE
jgi:chromosome segregation ATPase